MFVIFFLKRLLCYVCLYKNFVYFFKSIVNFIEFYLFFGFNVVGFGFVFLFFEIDDVVCIKECLYFSVFLKEFD